MTKIAPQGVRQRGFPMLINATILKPGDVFIATPEVGHSDDFTIPIGCIGIVHKEVGLPSSISVIRDDCKAARKALRNDGQAMTSLLSEKMALLQKGIIGVNPDEGFEVMDGKIVEANHFESGPPDEEFSDLKNNAAWMREE